MAAQSDAPERGSPPRDGRKLASIWRKVFGKDQVPNAAPTTATAPISPPPSRPTSPAELIRRVSRKVVPGLPRAKTFKRQQSEDRTRLEPTETSQAERRAVSVDRRVRPQHSHRSLSPPPSQHHESAPDFVGAVQPLNMAELARSHAVSGPPSPVEDDFEWPAAPNDRPAHQDGRYEDNDDVHVRDQSPAPSTADTRSVTSSAYEDRLKHELETEWILNLSMHFRDKSKREKFFVTYRQAPHTWRRVTISLDYRNAPEDSLELDLSHAKYQRDKSSRIYEAIRDSLQDIQFYDTVTNLKLQTTDGRLHVHVVEDVNEIIHYPTVQNVMHLNCRLIHERELKFDSHMSGFVYKVEHQDQILIKKEIPGPDTVDEFLYEVNALSALTNSPDIINFYGVVVDDYNNIKGLLIDYAEQGALVDVIYHAAESGASIDWQMKQRWARQIVQGLSDVHEAGFVQGDFTLSNIVIDEDQNAKIIDINRRGCPVGWEPPEATPLIECNQRISMYIGVKSDLFQLGMVLWALATMEDEPEAHRRPLRIGSDIGVPKWYRTIVNSCLNPDPRCRLQAAELLKHFPKRIRTISVEEDDSIHRFEVVDNEDSEWPRIKTVERPYIRTVNPYAFDPPASPTFSDNSYDPPRGRSPARPLPKEPGMMDVPFFSPAYQGYAEGEHTDDEAETPQETPTMETIAKTLKQNLHGIEAKLPEEPSDRLALPTDGNSQKEEVMPTNVTTLSHEKASNGFPENNTTLLRDDDPAPKTEELYDHVLPEKLGNAAHVDESKMPSSLDDTPPSTFSSTGGRTDYDAPNHPHALQADHAVLLSKDLDSDFQGDLVLDGACEAVRDDLVPSKDVRENDAKYGPQHGAMQAEFIGIGAAHGHSP